MANPAVQKAVANGIKSLMLKFREMPGMFFSEMQMHGYLFSRLYQNPVFSGGRGAVAAADGIKTTKLQLAYAKKDGNNKETEYDIIVFDPTYIRRTKHRNLMRFDTESRAELVLDAGIEIKLLKSNSFGRIAKDVRKLQVCNEAANKYMIAFSIAPGSDDYFFKPGGDKGDTTLQQLARETGVRILYVRMRPGDVHPSAWCGPDHFVDIPKSWTPNALR